MLKNVLYKQCAGQGHVKVIILPPNIFHRETWTKHLLQEGPAPFPLAAKSSFLLCGLQRLTIKVRILFLVM